METRASLAISYLQTDPTLLTPTTFSKYLPSLYLLWQFSFKRRSSVCTYFHAGGNFTTKILKVIRVCLIGFCISLSLALR